MLEFRLIGLLWWLKKQYGNKFHRTYKQIAEDAKNVSYATIRFNLLELEKSGYISIENRNTWKQTYIINKKRYNKLFNETTKE